MCTDDLYNKSSILKQWVTSVNENMLYIVNYMQHWVTCPVVLNDIVLLSELPICKIKSFCANCLYCKKDLETDTEKIGTPYRDVNWLSIHVHTLSLDYIII